MEATWVDNKASEDLADTVLALVDSGVSKDLSRLLTSGLSHAKPQCKEMVVAFV